MTRDQLAKLLDANAGKSSPLDVLDNRQVELISLISQGYNGTNICRELNLTAEDLAKLKADTQKRLGLKNEVQLVQFAAAQRQHQ